LIVLGGTAAIEKAAQQAGVDIYDGNRPIQKNNPERLARIYDLQKFPAVKHPAFGALTLKIHSLPFVRYRSNKYI